MFWLIVVLLWLPAGFSVLLAVQYRIWSRTAEPGTSVTVEELVRDLGGELSEYNLFFMSALWPVIAFFLLLDVLFAWIKPVTTRIWDKIKVIKLP